MGVEHRIPDFVATHRLTLFTAYSNRKVCSGDGSMWEHTSIKAL